MTTPLQEAQLSIHKARQALSRGDRRMARELAERASKLAPQLEDSWLILAAVAGPSLGVTYIQRALQINPESPRARGGMEWAMRYLQEPGEDLGETRRHAAVQIEETRQTRAVQPRRPVKATRGVLLPLFLLAVGCLILGLTGWTAMTSPVVASMLADPLATAQPTQAMQWAQASIPKPTYTAEAPVAQALPNATPTPAADEGFSGSPADPSEELPTDSPTVAPTAMAAEAEIPTVEPTWSGSLSMELVQDTPTPDVPYTPPTAAAPNPGNVSGGAHWIDVDLTRQMVYAYAGDTVVNSFLASTGTWLTPTVTGKFKIWIKIRVQDMSGPDYYLPDVPYVMYFYKDYGLHGTYWHNNFGTPMSHGCVNLSIPDAEWLYSFASEGTVVNVHY